jgi:hypothetical protein
MSPDHALSESQGPNHPGMLMRLRMMVALERLWYNLMKQHRSLVGVSSARCPLASLAQGSRICIGVH